MCNNSWESGQEGEEISLQICELNMKCQLIKLKSTKFRMGKKGEIVKGSLKETNVVNPPGVAVTPYGP